MSLALASSSLEVSAFPKLTMGASHRAFAEQLPRFFDNPGMFGHEATSAMRVHLKNCPHCRALHEKLVQAQRQE